MKRVISDLSALETFAKEFVEAYPSGAVVALEGELGAGKTTFVRAVVAQLFAAQKQAPPRIVSPTFVLHQRYFAGGRSIDHFDLYRLHAIDTSAAIEIGLHESLEQRGDGFVFVEWPSRLTPDAGVPFTTAINIQIQNDGSREMTISR